MIPHPQGEKLLQVSLQVSLSLSLYTTYIIELFIVKLLTDRRLSFGISHMYSDLRMGTKVGYLNQLSPYGEMPDWGMKKK